MKDVHKCPFCGVHVGCGCTGRFTRLVELLSAAEHRVSTLKPTSCTGSQSPIAVMIDKLSFNLASPIPEQDLKERLRLAGLEWKHTKHRDHRWCIQVGSETSGFYFRLGSRSFPYCSQLVTRPSEFSTFADYQYQLGRILSGRELEDSRITRLDIAIDYPKDLATVLSGFDFKRKQAQVCFLDKGGQRTGIRVGKGAERIQVYDKAVEADQPGSLTRIEIQLSGKKLPTRDLSRLTKVLSKGNWNPFDQISLNNVVLPENSASLADSQQERLASLAPILNREGLFSARRIFNKQGNFIRDFQPLIKIQPWQEQPSESFKKHFVGFLNTNREAEPNGTHYQAEASQS